MRNLVILVAAGTVLSSVSAFAYDSRTEAVLRKLEPETRFNQICDLAAMAKIRKDEPDLKPDRMALDALADPDRDGDVLTARALRSAAEASGSGSRSPVAPPPTACW